MMLDRILVALDGTAKTEALLGWVDRLARAADSSVLLARAVSEGRTGAASEDIAHAERQLAELDVPGALAVERRVVIGDPEEALLRLAIAEGVTLIAVRSDKASRFAAASGLRILRRSPTPCLLVGPATRPPSAPTGAIMAAVDRGRTSLAALPAAEEASHALRSRLVLLHAMRAEDPQWENPFREALATLHSHGVDAALRGVIGEPATAIVEAAAAQGFALVVMATHSREGLTRALLGSVTESVLARTPVPVLAVRAA